MAWQLTTSFRDLQWHPWGVIVPTWLIWSNAMGAGMFMMCVMNGIKPRRYKTLFPKYLEIKKQDLRLNSHIWRRHIFKLSLLDSSLFVCVHAYSMCSFSMAFKTLQQLIFCPSPPSFWHVPTRSTLCHGNRGWHHTFGRAGRWWWKGETVTVHWILCNQDPGDSIAYQVREWKTECGGSLLLFPQQKTTTKTNQPISISISCEFSFIFS